MDNIKSHILKERKIFAWVILWLLFVFIAVIVYKDGLRFLEINETVTFWDWISVAISPHNWFGIALSGITLNGLCLIWIFIEQKYLIIKEFRFIPIASIIGFVLILIGLNF